MLAAQGISITFQKAGSREIATRPDLKSFDVAFPVGAHAAVKIAQTAGSKQIYPIFFKSMRWKELPDNTAYSVNKSILVTLTHVRKSNSGAMYLALAAYLANCNNVVDNEADVNKVAPKMVGLFSRQGFQESSSAGPFEDYTAMGIGKAPLVMIYEQQFLELCSGASES